MLSLAPSLVAVVVSVVVIAGVVNGVAGFGFALVGTMALATVIDPATAVVFMIVPILAANVTLVRELSTSDLRQCGQRFAPLVGAAILGTVVGMAVLDRIPQAPLQVLLGLLALAFVATAQEAVPIPGLERAKAGCFVESPAGMVGVGGLSGLLGLYPDVTIFALSVAAAIPAVAGVTVGSHLRDRVSEPHRRVAVLALLSLVGVRLVLGGLGLD